MPFWKSRLYHEVVPKRLISLSWTPCRTMSCTVGFTSVCCRWPDEKVEKGLTQILRIPSDRLIDWNAWFSIASSSSWILFRRWRGRHYGTISCNLSSLDILMTTFSSCVTKFRTESIPKGAKLCVEWTQPWVFDKSFLMCLRPTKKDIINKNFSTSKTSRLSSLK